MPHTDDRASRRPGPKPTLSRAQIACAALEIADAEGLDAVSMARVATAVGFTTMALYRHVANKTELVELVIDAAAGELPELLAAAGTPGAGWRDQIGHWARACADCFAAHPWLLAATARRGREMGPAETSWLERALDALAPLDLDDVDARGAALLVLGHVRTHAQFGPDTLRHPDPYLEFGIGVILDGLDRRATNGA